MQYSWARRGSTSSQYQGWMPRLITVLLRFQRRPSAAKKDCRPPHSGRPDGRQMTGKDGPEVAPVIPHDVGPPVRDATATTASLTPPVTCWSTAYTRATTETSWQFTSVIAHVPMICRTYSAGRPSRPSPSIERKKLPHFGKPKKLSACSTG